MRLIHRIILSVIVSGLVFIITFYLALFQFGLVENLANRLLSDIIGEKLPLNVYIDTIDGDLFSELVIKDLSVSYIDNAERYTMAYIPELSIEYSLRDFWQGRIILQKVFIDSAMFSLKQSPDGEWLVPKSEGKSEPGSAFDIEINELGLNNLSMEFIKPDDTLSFSNIILKARFKGQDNTYAIDIDGLSYHSSDERFNLNSAGGKITLNGKNLLFQDVFMMTDSSDIRLGGHAVLDRSPRCNVVMKANNINMSEVSAFLKATLRGNLAIDGEMLYAFKALTGTVDVSGDFMERSFDSLHTRFRYENKQLKFDTLSGTILHGCRINAVAGLDFKPDPDEYYLAGFLYDMNLNNIVPNTFDTRLTGVLNMNGRGMHKQDMAMDITVNFDESWFDIYHSHGISGDILVTTDSIIFNDNFSVAFAGNEFIASGKLEYKGDLDIAGDIAFNNLSAFDSLIFIQVLGGRGQANFHATGKTSNPNLAGHFESDSLWLYEIFSNNAVIDCDIDRFLYDRDGMVDMTLLNGTIYDFPYDAVMMTMAIDSQYVDIVESYLTNPHTVIDGIGTLDYMSYPQRLAFDDITIDILGIPFRNRSRLIIDIDSTGYEFVDCRLMPSVGFISGQGHIGYDQTLDFHLEMDRVKISPWLKLFTDEYDVTGEMSGKLDLTGDFSSPMAKFSGRIDSLIYMGGFLGDLYTGLEYKDSLITVDSIYIDSHTGYYRASGTFPVDLSFTEKEQRFYGAEQSIDIVAHDTRHVLPTLLMSQIESLEGPFDASFRLTGEPRTPNIDGQAQLRSGILKPFELELPIENLNLDMHMKNKTITIDSASAICRNGGRSRGTVSGKGTIIINSIDELVYDIDLGITEFPARYELGDISAVVDANLNIKGITPPTVSGEITVLSAMYRENFAEEDEGWMVLLSLEDAKSWNLNLNAEIASNLWIKNDDIDAELAGSLNFIREGGKYRYIGSLEILRGKGYLADRTFRIEPGGTIYYEDIEYPDPRLDIYASTKIRGASDDVGPFEEPETKTYDLRIHVTGTQEVPIISAAEDSPFSTEEILTLVFTNYYAGNSDQTGNTTGQIEDRILSGLSGLGGSYLTQVGSRKLGVETFEIDPVYSDKFDPLGTQLTVGTYFVHPNLYIYGKSDISWSAGRELGFEYRIKRFLLVEGRVGEENLYHLFLNFHWDY